MADKAVRLAEWATTLASDVGASIYSLPPAHRVEAGIAAHAAGVWIHVDVILRRDAEGGFANSGVSLSDTMRILEAAPGARLEIHLMVIAEGQGWEATVVDLVHSLHAFRIQRWVGRAEVLDVLLPLLADDVEHWVEVFPPRDSGIEPRGNGALVMLIEPGSRGRADPAAVEVVANLSAAGWPVGVDGGVTPAIAEAVVAAGGSHIVAGRALWELETIRSAARMDQ